MGFLPAIEASLSGIAPVAPLQFCDLGGAVVDLWQAEASRKAHGAYRAAHPRLVVFLDGPSDAMQMTTPTLQQTGATVLFVPAEMPLELHCALGTQLRHVDLHFSAENLSRRLEMLGVRQVPATGRFLADAPQIGGIATLIATSLGSPCPTKIALDGLVTAALASVFSDAPDGQGRAGRPVLTARQIAAVTARAKADLSATISVADMAAAAGLSTSWFAHAFRDSLGQSPLRWLMDLRVTAAAEMLALQPGASLADIAAANGFADQSHLTRAFKAKYGLPPARWRRSVAAQAFLQQP